MFVQFPSQDTEKKSKAIGMVVEPQGKIEAGIVYFYIQHTEDCCYDCSVQRRRKVTRKPKKADDFF